MIKGMVSVIIPVYNVQPYLEKCLDSVVNQEYDNLEIICIDDGSIDGSAEIIDSYALKDSRFRVVHQNNAGVSSARNVGLQMVRGEFFGFIDADDYIDHNMYKVLVEAIEEGADISACAYYFDKAGAIVQTHNKRHVPEYTICTKKFMKYIYYRDRYKAVGGYLWSRLFRTETFRNGSQWKVRFDENLTNGEDALFLAECVVLSRKMIFKKQYLYYYVQRQESASHNYRQRVKGMSSLNAYTKILEAYTKAGYGKNHKILIERFLVYHASLLLEYAEKYDMHENDEEIKGIIRKFLSEYIITNLSNMKRVARIIKLVK